MLDSTWAYQYPEALRVGRAIEELGFYWYEDPLADDDIYNYVKLKAQLHIPILATEYSPGGFTAFAPWIVACATDFLRGDVAVKGGITALVKTAHLAEAFHMKFEGHHGGNSLHNRANLHAIMAIRNCEFFEGLLPAGPHKDGGRLEVLEPRGADGFLHRFLAQRGPGIHHVTFIVPSLRGVCEHAEAAGHAIVGYDDSNPDWREAFLHPKRALGIVVQLVEIVETRPRSDGERRSRWVVPPGPPNPPLVTVLGLRMRARSRERAEAQWVRLLGAEAIELASERAIALPAGPHPVLGAVFTA